MIVAVDFNLRNLSFYSISTGKEVHVHKLARHSTISKFHRQGRWLFIDYTDAGSDPSFSGPAAFDLQSLVFHDWQQLFGRQLEGKCFKGSSRHCAFFQDRWKENTTWYACRLDDGVVVEGTAEMQYPYFVMQYTPGFVHTVRHTGDSWITLVYRIDSNGLPTKDLLWEATSAGGIIATREGFSLWANAQGKETWVKCHNDVFETCYSLQFPSHAAAMEVGSHPGALVAPCGKGVIFRFLDRSAGMSTEIRRQQLLGLDLRTGASLWEREIASRSSNAAFLVENKILVHDSEGIDVIDVEKGELQRFSLPQVRCLSGSGAYLGGTNDARSGFAPIPHNPYFLWQTEPGKPMILGRISE